MMTAASTAQVIHPATGPAPSTLTGQLLDDVEGVLKTAVHPEHGEPTELGELLSRTFHVILGKPFDDALLSLKKWIAHLQSFAGGPDKVALTTTADSITRMHRVRIHKLVAPWMEAMVALLQVLMQERYITIQKSGEKIVVSAGENYPYWGKY